MIKWYHRLWIILMVLLSAAVAGIIGLGIRNQTGTPLAVAADENHFAVAKRQSGKYYISFSDDTGSIEKTIRPEIAESETLREIGLSRDTCYVWSAAEGKVGLQSVSVSVCDFESGQTNIIRSTELAGNLTGMQVTEDTLYLTTVEVGERYSQIDVYQAESDAVSFSLLRSFTCSANSAIRQTVYREDGTVILLTADGTLRQVGASGTSVLGATDAKTLLTNGEQALCLIDSQDRLLSWNAETDTAETYLSEMTSGLQRLYADADAYSVQKCAVYSASRAVMLLSDAENQSTAVLYAGGKLQPIALSAVHSVALFVLILLGIFLGSLLLLTALSVIALHLLHDAVSMKQRISWICVSLAGVLLVFVTIFLFQFYRDQREQQQWERLVITQNNTSLYLQSDEQGSLQWLLEDSLGQTTAQQRYAKKLQALPFTETAPSCVLFVADANGTLSCVTGFTTHFGETPEQYYAKGTANAIEAAVQSGKDSVQKLYFSKDGEDWIGLLHVGKAENGDNYVMLMQMPLESRQDYQILFSDILLWGAFAGFLVLLLFRIRSVLRPLAQMEERAMQFTATGKAEPLELRGHNEITMLTACFNRAIADLSESMKKSENSARAYSRFVAKELPEWMHKDNLSALHVGDTASCPMTVLYLAISPKRQFSDAQQEMQQWNALYSRMIPVVQKNGGVIQWESAQEMRILFHDHAFEAVCTASMIREIAEDTFSLRLVADYATASLTVIGTKAHLHLSAELPHETERFSVLRENGAAFGCTILITGEVAARIPDFSETFNHRTIGFPIGNAQQKEALHMIEILPQKCSADFEKAVRLYQAGMYKDAFLYFSAALEKNRTDAAAIHYLYLCNQKIHGEEETS